MFYLNCCKQVILWVGVGDWKGVGRGIGVGYRSAAPANTRRRQKHQQDRSETVGLSVKTSTHSNCKNNTRPYCAQRGILLINKGRPKNTAQRNLELQKGGFFHISCFIGHYLKNYKLTVRS